MNSISFFTPIIYSAYPKSACHTFLEIVDSYFYLGGRKAIVIFTETQKNREGVNLITGSTSLLTTASKIFSYCTVIIPLIMLITKAILRSSHNFYETHLSLAKIKYPIEKKLLQDIQCSCATTIQQAYKKYKKQLTKKKTLAALKIQTIYRKYKAKTNAFNLLRKKEAIAIKILTGFRKKKARLAVEKIKQLEQQRLATKIQQQQKINDEALRVKVVQTQTIKKFPHYTLELSVPKTTKKKIDINKEKDVEDLLKEILETITRDHCLIKIYFEWPTRDNEVLLRMGNFQNTSSAKSLLFNISKTDDRTIIIHSKPSTIEDLGDGKIRLSYANGVIEVFRAQDLYGTRNFPNGKKEHGYFAKSGEILSGYRIETDGKVEFINPEFLVRYKIEINSNEHEFQIIEFEERLTVIEKTQDENYNTHYSIIDVNIEDALLKASQRRQYEIDKNINPVLLHKDFDKHRNHFIDTVLAPDESKIPRLFSFSQLAALNIIEAGHKTGSIDPLKIVDPISGRNFFIQAGTWGDSALLDKLILLFPQAFQSAGLSVIEECIQHNHQKSLSSKLVEKFNEGGGQLDAYHSLWIQIVHGNKLDEACNKEFSILPKEQQRVLYDAAFAYDNSFVQEPSDSTIKADQYSINLMWINKTRMPNEQEFLFGEGSTSKQRKLDFNIRFVDPVSRWATANPGTPINIWVDGEMATSKAIERSKAALMDALDNTFQTTVHFRDVRSMEVVRSNPQVFSEKVPVYFRVDLLRAIAADFVLCNKETQFFVYGDIDMNPLSRQELFDKRTVNNLNDLGFVMAKGGHLGFENGFQILNGNNHTFVDSHRKVIIDLTVEMALQRPNAIKEQQLYDTYPALLTYILDVDGRYGKLKLDRPKIDNATASEKLKYFRYDRFANAAHSFLPFGEGLDLSIKDIMPRKPVQLPPSHF